MIIKNLRKKLSTDICSGAWKYQVQVQNRLAKPAQHRVPDPERASGQAVRALAHTFGDSAPGGFFRQIVPPLPACTTKWRTLRSARRTSRLPFSVEARDLRRRKQMMAVGHKSVESNTNSSMNFIMRVCVLVVFIALILSGCSPRASNEYDLKKLVNAEKLQASELDSIAHILRTSVEQYSRRHTEWLYYWMNAQAVKMCGRISVDNPQMPETDLPVEPVNLQDVVLLVVQVEYHGETETQFANDSMEVPIVKIVEGKLIYKSDHWEVKSFEEQPQDYLPDNCAIQINR
jgi:hypothetical protein